MQCVISTDYVFSLAFAATTLEIVANLRPSTENRGQIKRKLSLHRIGIFCDFFED